MPISYSGLVPSCDTSILPNKIKRLCHFSEIAKQVMSHFLLSVIMMTAQSDDNVAKLCEIIHD